MRQDNVIELNGKRYNAITGEMLGKSHAPALPIAGHKPAPTRVIDGFIRPKTKPHLPHKVRELEAKKAAKPIVPKQRVEPEKHHAKGLSKRDARDVVPPPAHPKTNHDAHPLAKHVKAHHPEHAKTLMRHSVHKPAVSPKPAIKTQVPAELIAPTYTIMPKHSVTNVDPARMDRAHHTARHSQVQRFNHAASHHTTAPLTPATIQPLPVRPEPPAIPATHHPKPTDAFERAIAHAVSHEQPAHRAHHRSKRKRFTSMLAAIAAFLVIGGFITYLNLPTINLQIASMQAGFSARMPDYKPVGYALSGPIKHDPGKVTLSFRSGDSSFQITQQPSDWNSQTLLDNVVGYTGRHQTMQSKGLTVYVYDGHSAVWVDGGIRYDITGTAELSNGDILSIANSL